MGKTVQKIIGDELRAAMARKQWSTFDLAGNLDISQSTVARYVRGERDVPTSIMLNALRMLDVPYAEFAARVEREMDRGIAEVGEWLDKRITDARSAE